MANDSEQATGFAISSQRIKAAVGAASEGQDEWPVQVAAAVYAAIEFAIAEPAAMRELTLGEPARRSTHDDRCGGLVDYFAQRLRDGAPAGDPPPRPAHRAPIHTIAHIVGNHLRAGRAERLLEVGPELVQLTLLPYLGFEQAKHWAEKTSGSVAKRDG